MIKVNWKKAKLHWKSAGKVWKSHKIYDLKSEEINSIEKLVSVSVFSEKKKYFTMKPRIPAQSDPLNNLEKHIAILGERCAYILNQYSELEFCSYDHYTN